MSKSNPVQKKALKKRAAENQNELYKEILKADFLFITQLLQFGSECVTDDGSLDVHDLLFLKEDQFTPSQREIIKNFKKYVLIDKYGSDDVINVERIEDELH